MKTYNIKFIVPAIGSILVTANSKENAIQSFKQFDEYFLMNHTTSLENVFFCEDCDVTELP